MPTLYENHSTIATEFDKKDPYRISLANRGIITSRLMGSLHIHLSQYLQDEREGRDRVQ